MEMNRGIFKILNLLKNIFINLLLVFLSILFVLVLLEISLRYIRPRYKYAAEGNSEADQSRIWRNPRNRRYYQKHPDLVKKHLAIFNSLGFRQHREFAIKKPKDVTRIGFFGDSYTVNLDKEIQYSFTELLDYLLNKTKKKYEVLNFGTDGYGTDQVYIQYLQEGKKLDLDVVFYVYCRNDIRNVTENNLFTIDSEGNIKIVQHKYNKFLTHVNQLYIPYLFIDFCNRLENKLVEVDNTMLRFEFNKRFHLPRFEAMEESFQNGVITREVDRALKIYLAILFKLKEACKQNNTKLYILITPSIKNDNMYKLLLNNDFEVLNLTDKCKEIYKNSEYTFKNDGHWNEEGNKLAAIFLFKFLAEKLSISYQNNAFIEQALYEYYNSFNSCNVRDFFVKQYRHLNPTIKKTVRLRYLSLEIPKKNLN
jgi:hypothetical protein